MDKSETRIIFRQSYDNAAGGAARTFLALLAAGVCSFVFVCIALKITWLIWIPLVLLIGTFIYLKPRILGYAAPLTLLFWVPLFSIGGSNFAPHDLVVLGMYALSFTKIFGHAKETNIKAAFLMLALAWAIFVPGALGVIFSVGPSYLWSALATHAKRFAMASVYPAYLLLFFKNNRDFEKLLLAWWVAGTALSTLTLGQVFLGEFEIERAQGILYNPNDVGGWAVFTVTLSFWFISRGKRWGWSGVALGVLALFASASRSWSLGLLASFLGWVLAFGLRRQMKIAISLVLLLGLSHVVKLDTLLLKRWEPVFEAKLASEPAIARLALYKLGLTMASKSLIFGYGPGKALSISSYNFYKTIEEARVFSAYGYYTTGIVPVDNLFVQHLVEFGLAGTILLVLILYIVIKNSINIRDPRLRGMTWAYLLGLAAVSFTTSSILSYWISPLFWLIVAVVFWQKTQEERSD